MATGTATSLEEARLLAYVRKVGIQESATLKKCRLETLKNRSDATMMTAPEEAAFLAFVVKLIGAKKGLEIGVFTGYSSIALAKALPDDGTLTVCEMDAELLNIAAGYWQEADLSHKITSYQGDAVISLQKLLTEDNLESFDFVYIDANKEGYRDYYEFALQLVKPNGLVMIDNTLWSGRVADRAQQDSTTQAIRSLNEFICSDPRVESVLTTLGDGVTFIRKL